MYPNCLKDLVGLTTEPGQCLSGSNISNVSTLDLFVNHDPAYDSCRLKGGDTACELIKLMSEMREEALRQVTVDIGAMLASRSRLKADVSYYIGQNEHGSYYAPDLVPEKPALYIYTVNQPGAYIRIDRIALMMLPLNGDMIVPLRVYKQIPEEPDQQLHVFNIPVTRMSTMPQPVVSYTLPCDGSTYRFEYTYDPVNMQVVDSNYHCGCGDKLKVSKGFILENISKTYGISLYTTMFCESGQVICGLIKDDTYKLVVGHMIRKLTISLLLKKILYKQDINRFSLLSPEDVTNQLDAYAAEYASRLSWIEQQRDFDIAGFCVTCVGGQQVRKYNMLTGN